MWPQGSQLNYSITKLYFKPVSLSLAVPLVHCFTARACCLSSSFVRAGIWARPNAATVQCANHSLQTKIARNIVRINCSATLFGSHTFVRAPSNGNVKAMEYCEEHKNDDKKKHDERTWYRRAFGFIHSRPSTCLPKQIELVHCAIRMTPNAKSK